MSIQPYDEWSAYHFSHIDGKLSQSIDGLYEALAKLDDVYENIEDLHDVDGTEMNAVAEHVEKAVTILMKLQQKNSHYFTYGITGENM